MAAPVTVVDALLVYVLFFFSLPFIALGMVGLGRGKPEAAGVVYTVVGLFEGIIGFVIIVANLGSPIFISVGTLILIFAFTWLTAGIISLRGYDLVPLGNACICSGIMMLAYAAFLVINRGLYSPIGLAWLLVNILSWAWAFWSVTLAAYGKIKLHIVGWTFLSQAFYTLLIPAALLLMGVVSVLKI